MHSLIPFLAVGLGSMAGGISRYGLSLATQNLSAFSMPYGTLLSNVLGCLLIGLLAGLGAKTELMSTEMPAVPPTLPDEARNCRRLLSMLNSTPISTPNWIHPCLKDFWASTTKRWKS